MLLLFFIHTQVSSFLATLCHKRQLGPKRCLGSATYRTGACYDYEVHLQSCITPHNYLIINWIKIRAIWSSEKCSHTVFTLQ